MSSDQTNTAQDAHGIAKITLDNLTDFQRELHLPPNDGTPHIIQELQNIPLEKFMSGKTTAKFLLEISELVEERIEEHKNNLVESHFSANCKRMSWATHIPVNMECKNESNTLIYTCNSKFDFFMHCYMRTTFPALEVKDSVKERYQICWPHNVGTNICKEGILRYDDDTAQTIDNVWLDISGQFFIDPGFRDLYNTTIGNIPCLEEWTTSLPEYPTDVPQPWYYSKHISLAIPLCLCSKSRVTHTYTPRLKIEELLRIRVMKNYKDVIADDGNKIKPIWVPGKFNAKLIKGIPKDGLIATPELWGRYALVTDEERKWHRTASSSIKYIQDIVRISSDNPKTYGQTEDLKILTTTPCLAMFWVGENMDATKHRNRSNYTTNSEDVYAGWNPCKNASLMIGIGYRFKELPSDHFDRMEPWYYFKSPPTEPGYNACSLSFDPNNLDNDVGITFDQNYSLKVKLGDTCPFLKKPKTIGTLDDEFIGDNELIEPEELKIHDEVVPTSGSNEFKIHVRLLVMKKLLTEVDPETGTIVKCVVSDV